MTIEEFYAFTDARPDEEKWELIDGEPVLNAAPSNRHQIILGNLVSALTVQERRLSASWKAIPGIGVRLSNIRRPEPDVLIYPKSSLRGDRDRDDVIVTFEVMSPSTEGLDLKWKRTAYTGLSSLTDYVVVAQEVVEVVVFARDNDFAERRYRSLDEVIAFPSLGVSLPLSEIYRDTGLAQKPAAPRPQLF